MNFVSTNCCGICEITALSSHKDNMDSAMMVFVDKQVMTPVDYKGGRSQKNAIYSHYLFTAAVYETDLKNGKYNSYGHQFAKFIEDNKLGSVVQTPEVVNEAFHPDHKVAAWMWTTDYPAIKAWIKKNMPSFEVKKLERQIQSTESLLESNKKYAETYKSSAYDRQYYQAQVKAYESKLADLKKQLEIEQAKLKAEQADEEQVAEKKVTRKKAA